MIVAIEKYTSRTKVPRVRRTLTPVWDSKKQPTFVAPVKDAGGRARPQSWQAFSRDGLWNYQRYETGGRTAWRVTYLPTGQTRDDFSGKDDARAATAHRLVDELRTEAFARALRTTLDDPDRPAGHAQLAVHLRLARVVDGQEAKHRCECGGFIGDVTSDGDLAHLDACDLCYTYGRGLPLKTCPNAGQHRFCGDPVPAGWQTGCGLWRQGCCPGDCKPC